MFSTIGGAQYCGGVQYFGGIMMHVGDILSTVGVFSTVGDIMINMWDILSIMGEQRGKTTDWSIFVGKPPLIDQ